MKNFKEEYLDRYGYNKTNYFEDNGEDDYEAGVKTLYDYLQDNNGKEQMYRVVKDIVESMDFEKIHNVMDFLNWTWASVANGKRVPTEEEIKQHLINMLFDMFEEGYEKHRSEWSCSTAGFTVSYRIFKPDIGEADDFEHCVSVTVAFNLDDYNSLW